MCGSRAMLVMISPGISSGSSGCPSGGGMSFVFYGYTTHPIIIMKLSHLAKMHNKRKGIRTMMQIKGLVPSLFDMNHYLNCVGCVMVLSVCCVGLFILVDRCPWPRSTR